MLKKALGLVKRGSRTYISNAKQILKTLIRILAIAGSIFLVSSLNAQLMNGSFEFVSTIPQSLGNWQVVENWDNAGSSAASPDYYHYNGSLATDLPETPMAIVNPQHGQAVMGLMVCGKHLTNTREYLAAQLGQSLITGRQYTLSFYITNGARTPTSVAGLGVDKLGIHFSVGSLSQAGLSPVNAVPQCRIDEVVYDAAWHQYTFTFTADQAYTHMTFGLFGDDNDKNIQIFEGSDPLYAYYFLDKFELKIMEEDSNIGEDGSKGPVAVIEEPQGPPSQEVVLTDPFFVPNTFTPNGDGNNDVFLPVSNAVKEWKLEIFNSWGERLFATEDEMNGWDGSFQSATCSSGSYVWQITYIEFYGERGRREVCKKGVFHLVR